MNNRVLELQAQIAVLKEKKSKTKRDIEELEKEIRTIKISEKEIPRRGEVYLIDNGYWQVYEVETDADYDDYRTVYVQEFKAAVQFPICMGINLEDFVGQKISYQAAAEVALNDLSVYIGDLEEKREVWRKAILDGQMVLLDYT